MKYKMLIAVLNDYGVSVLNDNFDSETVEYTCSIDFSKHDKMVAEEKDAQIRGLKRQIEDLEAIIAEGKKPDISVSENGVSVGCECGGYHLAKERIAELEREFKKCKDETNSWRHELARVNEECDIIAKDNGDLRKENHKLEKQASELRKEIIEKNQRMIELINEATEEREEKEYYKEKLSLLRTRCKPGIEKDFDKGLFGKLAIVGCNEEFTDIQNKRISELEDRHQSDCIRINQLLTTIDVLTERYQKLMEVHGL